MRPWPYPRVVAHRGGGTFAPENTVAALRVGHQRGFRGVEFDVALSADGEPVLMHDSTLNRTTNAKGPLAERTWSQLAQLDAGGWFSASFAGEPVARLVSAIDFCRGHQVWINAEIKPTPGADRQTGQQVARAIARAFADAISPLESPGAWPDARLPLLSSFSSEALAAAQDAEPALPRGLLCGRIPKNWREQLEGLQCVALHCDHRHLDARAIEAVHGAGYWVFSYTVNDPHRATQLAEWGLDAFCTDRLDLIDPAMLD